MNDLVLHKGRGHQSSVVSTIIINELLWIGESKCGKVF